MRITPILYLGFILLAACSDGDKAEEMRNNSMRDISGSGELVSEETLTLSPPAVAYQWEYKITFMASDGTQIKEGMPVLGFDSSKQQQDLIVAKSELTTAQKALENFVLNNNSTEEQNKLRLAETAMQVEKAERKVNASEGQLASIDVKKLKIDYELKQAEYAQAERAVKEHQRGFQIQKGSKIAEVKRLEATLSRLQEEIARLMIKAPKSGVVVHRMTWDGNKLKTGDSAYLGQPIIEIPSLNKMMAKVEFLEIDARFIAIGKEVEVRLDVEPDKVFSGEVKSIAKAIRKRSRNDATPVFDVMVSIHAEEGTVLRPGMAARVKLLGAKAT